jgi:hypothetical protein
VLVLSWLVSALTRLAMVFAVLFAGSTTMSMPSKQSLSELE